LPVKGNKIVQIAASGPDSDTPTILFSLLQAINLASKEILITTPYFIPGESLIDALIVSSLGGVSVKLLVPGTSDSRIVNAAARSYYADLLTAGVEIYLYNKGFVHAKTLVADKKVAIVGTANMDYRSFDLNFEVNAIVYDEELANELSDVFYEDTKYAEKIDLVSWNSRPVHMQMLEKTARLVSSLL
jgi:cardiolipin synthase